MQTTTDIAALVELVKTGGPVVVLTLFIVGASRGWWIFAEHHAEVVAGLVRERDEARKDADEWRELAFTGTALAEHTFSERRGGTR